MVGPFFGHLLAPTSFDTTLLEWLAGWLTDWPIAIVFVASSWSKQVFDQLANNNNEQEEF